MMKKLAGAPCPNCQRPHCAEFAQLGQAPRWSCQECGTEGDLIGDLSIRSKQDRKVPASAKTVHRAPKGLGLVLAFFLAAPAIAVDLVAQHGPNSVRLTTSECKVPAALSVILENNLDLSLFHAASAVIRGRRFEACWQWIEDDSAVGLLYEDGDSGRVERYELRPDEGV